MIGPTSSLTVMTYLAEEVDPPDLVGPGEIRQRLGVSKQRLNQIRHRPGFPPPALTVQMGDLWWRSDIDDWFAATSEQRDRARRVTGSHPQHVHEGAT